MEIQLRKKPFKCRLLVGFPGFGLVGTIATEFLIEHMKTEPIGRVMIKDLPAMVAIHENKLVEPLGLYYSQQYNLVILHAVTASQGIEWELAEVLLALQKELQSPEIISLEGVGGSDPTPEPATFYYATHKQQQDAMKKLNIEPLREGIIMGVTGALLLKAQTVPVTCVFAETRSNMPDSTAAAMVITALDKYLGLKVDPKPLYEQAKQFESKVKTLLSQGKRAQDMSDAKRLNYMG